VSHPTRRLDDAVHQRTRLGILTVLCEGGRADFGYLRDTLELTDGNLSRNISKLVDAGYVRIEKIAEGRRSRTWLNATPAGRAALNAEIAALREIIAAMDAPARQQRAQQHPAQWPLPEPT
jgi:DNA-binding MarR family transcriptional regulator